MPLIIIKKKDIPTLRHLHTLALRRIFERETLKLEEERELDHGIQIWARRADLMPHEKTELRRIINALIADEHGYFYRAKMIQKQHKINFRFIYRGGLPYIADEDC